MKQVKYPSDLVNYFPDMKEGEKVMVVSQGTVFIRQGKFLIQVGRGTKRSKARREKEWKRPVQTNLL